MVATFGASLNDGKRSPQAVAANEEFLLRVWSFPRYFPDSVQNDRGGFGVPLRHSRSCEMRIEIADPVRQHYRIGAGESDKRCAAPGRHESMSAGHRQH